MAAKEMRLHVLGLPHTVVGQAYSPCAFTGKILRFARMMQPRGYSVVEYSNGESESGAAVHVQILTALELAAASLRRGDDDYTADIANAALNEAFQRRLVRAVAQVARPGEIVCHVFGPNAEVMAALPACVHVESGIGYTCTEGACPYRVYESAAWMHWHLGRRHLEFGRNYEFVAPNYYDADEWDAVDEPPERPLVLFFGRLTGTKGLESVVEVARRLPATRFVLCGQGDGAAWAARAPNLEHLPPVYGRARSALLGSATALLAPTAFIEPFCGAAVEAQLCGTPVVCTSYGAFTETVEDGATGFRCHTLADLAAAVQRAGSLDRRYVALRARSLYTLDPVGRRYDEIFRDVLDLRGDGWYSARTHKAF